MIKQKKDELWVVVEGMRIVAYAPYHEARFWLGVDYIVINLETLQHLV